jgi:hypothetical protein
MQQTEDSNFSLIGEKVFHRNLIGKNGDCVTRLSGALYNEKFRGQYYIHSGFGQYSETLQGCQMRWYIFGSTSIPLMTFPLTMFPLKLSNDVSPNNVSPNVSVPLTTFPLKRFSNVSPKTQ